ncbi:Hypothetical protein PHPALM_13790 [Phytophthora palmivora]|uniref:Uncharacterized protein n=1 Tax=Phytophthora palmivora TaxID=4796 RepID=A0A2P4XWE8_9STRA|nr:Hypothetical protein PHPALM_13790 [Phytophthora palmivora]
MLLERLKASHGLNHGRISRGAYERGFVQDEPLFVNDIEAALSVYCSHHTEFLLRNLQASVRNRMTAVGPSPCGAREHHTQSQTEALFWRWVSLKHFLVQELKELREDRLLFFDLGQPDLRIAFDHLIAKRQLHPVMEGLRQQSKSSA